jgi:hypothetical protein
MCAHWQSGYAEREGSKQHPFTAGYPWLNATGLSRR